MGWGRWAGLAVLAAAMSAGSVAQPPAPITVIREPESEPLPTPSDFSQEVRKRKGPWIRVVASSNMAPTLLSGDRVAMVQLREPLKRGDVVLMEHTRNARYWLMERIIALPGDTVQMKSGHLFLNGQEVKRTKIRALTYVSRDDGPPQTTAIEYEEQLPGEERPHLIHEFSDWESYDDTPVFAVPEDHVFVMGDNRDNSEDSRAPTGHRELFAESPNGWRQRPGLLPSDTRYDAIGFVPIENLISRADSVIFSFYGCKLTAESKAAGVVCLAPNIGKRF